MTRLLEFWSKASSDFGFELAAPFRFKVSGGVVIDCEFLVKGYGAEKGMLIVRRYDDVSPHLKQIWEAGYGFAVLTEPGPDETYSKERYRAILEDWGKT